MDKTGSIAIARSVLAGRGALIALTGLLVLVTSAIAHATPSHLAAALLFGLGMAGLRILARRDDCVLSTPWRSVVRVTDLVSLAILVVATFGSLAIVAIGGHPGWDVAVLAGVLIAWWSALDKLIADYRRIRVALGIIAIAWLPVVLFHPSLAEIAHVAIVMAVVALAITIWSLWRSMSDVPAYYRLIDVNRRRDEAT